MSVGILLIDASQLRNLFSPEPVRLKCEIHDLFPVVTRQKLDVLLAEYKFALGRISSVPANVDQFVDLMAFLTDLETKTDGMSSGFKHVEEMMDLLITKEFKVPENDKTTFDTLNVTRNSFKTALIQAQTSTTDNIEKFSKLLTADIPKLQKAISDAIEDQKADIIADAGAKASDVLAVLGTMDVKLKEHEALAKKYERHQIVLGSEVVQYDEIKKARVDLDLKKQLWEAVSNFEVFSETYRSVSIFELEFTKVQASVTAYNKTSMQAKRRLEGNPVPQQLKDKIQEWLDILPIIEDLRTENFQERHYISLAQILNHKVHEDKKFSFESIKKIDYMAAKPLVATVANKARQEHQLQTQLDGIIDTWEGKDGKQLPLDNHADFKDVYILSNLEELMTTLDDSLMSMGQILGSPFVGPMQDKVKYWYELLILMQDTLKEWTACQRSWVYLESIFASPGIQRELSTDNAEFQKVDRGWKSIMQRAHDTDHAIELVRAPGLNLKETFRDYNDKLDKITKSLNRYLNTKRIAFPRFYFLSNEELLKILANAKDPRMVEPHLPKCFEAVHTLEFGGEGNRDIKAMRSPELEKIPLSTVVKARQVVEDWLKQLEKAMRDTLKKLMRQGVVALEHQPRGEWIMEKYAQVVMTVSQIAWARGCEQAIMSQDPLDAMKRWVEFQNLQLTELTRFARGKLDRGQRGKIVALITTDVHARDVCLDLVEEKVAHMGSFTWQQQLRFYWDSNEDDCLVRQSNAVFNYGYEYMGITTRLVITPLTDRCWMTITGALHIRFGAAPAGPAGTGKTESTKDLAKALGFWCIVFNCSEQVTFETTAKNFMGLAQCGAWTCLDEFNRIDIEVLSVIAQQVQCVREALLQKLDMFSFQGEMIALKTTFGVMITMNPGYAGRTELPDNLKVLFRPVSMMIPDYALIAKIMLYAEGFDTAPVLAIKMTKLYKLSSEQLSQQPHYDFGMRAVKSVLVMAGALKRSEPNVPEDQILIRAMVDSNIPKFLADDIPLFNAIVRDLFPNAELKQKELGLLNNTIMEMLEQQGLQSDVKPFNGKVVELFEIFTVRFGVMLVGPAGGGKSTCAKTLQLAMTTLRQQQHEDERFQNVEMHVLNPKCISMAELYGDVDKNTNDWTDGLASSIMRSALEDKSLDKHWVTFDGPVDALWIENMNTVLDDNMTLCLVNGERIKLKPALRMLFEVEDLSQASPATVSRCGMVYLTPSDLGVLPYVRTWVSSCYTTMQPGHRAYLYELFETLLPQGLEFLYENCKMPIPCVPVNVATSLCSIFESLFTEKNGINFADPLDTLKPITKLVFVFSYVWSVGGPIDEPSRAPLSNFFATLFADCKPAGNLYDYFVDMKERQWAEWNTIVTLFEYNQTMPYFQMVVPTLDTVRSGYVLKCLLSIEKSTFFTGASGTGKSILVYDILSQAEREGKLLAIPVTFSAQTNPRKLQLSLEDKMVALKRTLLGATPGKRNVIFVDDVNMPTKEKYGAQPPVELLRQYLDYRGFWDRKELFWKDIKDTTLLCAAAPPGGGRSTMTARFVRHFNMMCLPNPTNAIMNKIFSSILSGFLKTAGFKGVVQDLAPKIVKSTVELYEIIARDLLPTPAKSHYTFNLRDISKVFQGILMIGPMQCGTPEVMTRLWIHECSRTFSDRFTDAVDHGWYQGQIVSLLSRNFGLSWTVEDLFVKRTIMFGDFFTPGVRDQYEECTKDVGALLDEYLNEYNEQPSNLSMDLVFFSDAIQHISRIARVLRQPRGNAMLVGVGGSGKQSLTRLACYIAEFACYQIELSKGYDYKDFRENMKDIMKQAGLDKKETCFLMTDNQIIDERFLEDINNLLNSGDIPNLFEGEDLLEIVEKMIVVVRELGLQPTKAIMYNCFIERVRNHLHIVLGMSPVGDSFRSRCRKFPSLINCCTIDWYSKWPRDALMSVSSRFLSEINDLPDEKTRHLLSEMCVVVHQSVEAGCARFLASLRRYLYTTPKSFLDLIKLYVNIFKSKRETLTEKRDVLTVGLQKLRETNAEVARLQAALIKLQPELIIKQQQATELLEQVKVEDDKINKVKAVVEVDEKIASKQEVVAREATAEAQADLALALPLKDKALAALDSFTGADVAILKKMGSPVDEVRLTIVMVHTLLGGTKSDWKEMQKMVAGGSFKNDLFGLQKVIEEKGLEKKVLDRMQPFLDNPSLTVEILSNKSREASKLLDFTRSMVAYNSVVRDIAPKQEKVAQLSAELAIVQAALKEKKEALAKVERDAADLKAKCNAALESKNRAEAEAKTAERQLNAAQSLTKALGSEETSWDARQKQFKEDMEKLVGDAFLSAAAVSYIGGFTGAYRKALIKEWIVAMAEKKISHTADFQLANCLGDPMLVRQWQMNGLPFDESSIDSAIIASNADRFPLMIDPQLQFSNWLKNEFAQKIKLTKFTDKELLKNVEHCLRYGWACVIEDVGESLEPAIDPVLAQNCVQQGNILTIKLGDNSVEWNNQFRFFLITKNSNPHYLPETQIKVTLVNCTVTLEGLAGQLLAETVKKEAEQVETRRQRIVVQLASGKKKLAEMEAEILKTLKEAKGNILDSQDLIDKLQNSKATQDVIQAQVEQSVETQVQIEKTRQQYVPMSNLGSILFFVISDMAFIDPMYQYSLNYFSRLFLLAFDKAEKNDDVPTRLVNLKQVLIKLCYNNVCRGLFESHKLLFSFLICMKIQIDSGVITQEQFMFLLKGNGATVPDMTNIPPNPFPEILPESSWQLAVYFENEIKTFKGLTAETVRNSDAWRAFVLADDHQNITIPGVYQSTISTFDRLLMLKVFAPPKLMMAMASYVGISMGREFVESQQIDMDVIYADSDPITPIIFILSAGADPSSLLTRLAKKKGFLNKLNTISLGQGQGPRARELIANAFKNGEWALLQNCHLAKSWMQDLEDIVGGFAASEQRPHREFRLWLTAMPCNYFPVAVLQKGIKVTNEPPKGLRANLMRSYKNVIKAEEFETCTKPHPWKKLLFGLCFFHGIIQERMKFGPLGWNKRYEFNDSDLETSISNMRMFIEEQEHIPWDALRYVCGKINFGGRVTDEWDQRCLSTILNAYMDPALLTEDFKLSTSGLFYAPPEGPLDSYVKYLVDVKAGAENNPEVFGMHENANLTFQDNETKKILTSILEMQPRSAGGVGKTPDMVVTEVAKAIEEKLPGDFMRRGAHPDSFLMRGPVMDSLATVLIQEMDRYNILLKTMRYSLAQVQLAIMGRVVMSAELDLMYNSLLNNQIPDMWKSPIGPDSLKPLAAFIIDLLQKFEFFADWLKLGPPKSYWMNAFFFPQGFLTGVLQNYARKHRVAIDGLNFDFTVLNFRDKKGVTAAPEDGVYIYGLFLDGAAWDFKEGGLVDAEIGEMFTNVPVIHFRPDPNLVRRPADYDCPLYKTHVRAGVLSTTGISTNLVLSVQLPTKIKPSTWIMRGTAMLCQLSF